MQTIAGRFDSSAFLSQNPVCGRRPSQASHRPKWFYRDRHGRRLLNFLCLDVSLLRRMLKRGRASWVRPRVSSIVPVAGRRVNAGARRAAEHSRNPQPGRVEMLLLVALELLEQLLDVFDLDRKSTRLNS